MWKIKIWSLSQYEAYLSWKERNADRYQIVDLFINNKWGVEYRPLRRNV